MEEAAELGFTDEVFEDVATLERTEEAGLEEVTVELATEEAGLEEVAAEEAAAEDALDEDALEEAVFEERASDGTAELSGTEEVAAELSGTDVTVCEESGAEGAEADGTVSAAGIAVKLFPNRSSSAAVKTSVSAPMPTG